MAIHQNFVGLYVGLSCHARLQSFHRRRRRLKSHPIQNRPRAVLAFWKKLAPPRCYRRLKKLVPFYLSSGVYGYVDKVFYFHFVL